MRCWARTARARARSVKCAMGYYAADEGEILLNGRQVTIAHPRQAHELGLGMVYQHFTLVPNMTVLENFVLSREHLPAVIDWASERAAAEGLLLDHAVRRAARHAGRRSRRRPEAEGRDPAPALSQAEPADPRRADLGADARRGRRGAVDPEEADARQASSPSSIITHKFREVNAFCDTVTVLRRGKLVGTRPTAELDNDTMAEMMVGQRETRAIGRARAARAGQDRAAGRGA